MEDILDAVGAAETPLVLLTGFAGTGRTTALARLCERYETQRKHVSAMRFTSRGDVLPAKFSLSPAGRHGAAATRLRGPVRDEPAWATIGPVAGAADEPAVARRAAHAAAAALRRAGDGTVLLIDDLQWIDRHSLAVLEALIRMLDGRHLTCVGTLRVPVNGAAAHYGPDVLARLRKESLVHTLRLPPLDKGQMTDRLKNTLQAAPEPALVDRVHTASRGVYSAVRAATETLLRNGAIRVVGQSAFLVPGTARAEPPLPAECLQLVRELGPTVWESAKALAWLFPLGDAAPRLAGAVLGIAEREVLDHWESLRRVGVVHRGTAAMWRFTIPLVGDALAGFCGPYASRGLAAAAVEALWSSEALCHDPDHRANLVAEAGRLIDPARGTEELIGRAIEAGDANVRSAVRWLEAAADLADDPAQRANALLPLAAAYLAYGDQEKSVRTARLLLEGLEEHLGPDAVIEAQALLVRGLGDLGDTEALRDMADGELRLPCGAGERAALRSFACARLDRWMEAERWSEADGRASQDGRAHAVFGRLIKASGSLWQGRAEPFDQSLRDRERWPLRAVARYRFEQVDAHLTGLLVNGELGRAEKLLADEGLPLNGAGLANRVMAAALRGDFGSATELACRFVALGPGSGLFPARTGMFHAAVSALVSQGRFTAARELLTAARKQTPALAHLLDFAESRIDQALGDHRRAAERLTTALTAAEERGLVVGCDTAYAELADLALDAGDRKTAERCLIVVDRLAHDLATGRATLLALFIRAVVEHDPHVAAECLRRARSRNQPFELSLTIACLVKHGVADPSLLREAYELMGDGDALLHRAKARNLMREHGVAVPGRRETTEENERLLATLVAEGLSNKQIATALDLSEKSVEGRLSRLFSRSGYRSRIEISTAVVNGELNL